MNNSQLIDLLRELGLPGMAEAVEHESDSSAFAQLPWRERLMHLLHAESTWRDNRRQKLLLAAAHLKIPAATETIDFRPGRNIDRSQIAELQTCAWVRAKQNLIITGPTGAGKTHLACALGDQAARHGLRVRYVRTSQFLEDTARAHQDGSIRKVRAQLAKFSLLILDDFGLAPMTEAGKQDLLDLVDARINSGSILIGAQLAVKDWHDYIANPLVADALLDRLVNSSHKIQLTGESMRKARSGS